MPLGLWIKPPVSPEWYMSDWLSLGEQGALDVVEAIRSAITKQRAHVATRHLELLERHAEPGYRVEVEPLGPKRKTTNPPRLYRLGVDPDVAMSLLKQTTAHALLIAKEPGTWIRKCAHNGCDGFLFPDHPKKMFCQRHQR
jgi:predicted RNA-binding Zn ribbon-like protein